jgi:ribosome maturation factor RimP
MHENIINIIKQLSEPIVQEQDMFLVEVELKHQKIPEIWVFIDSEHGGVSVDKCSKISREISAVVDDENIMGGAYRLNVSSPGLSRPLSDKRQYAKNRGRTAKIKYKEEDNYQSVEGVIDEVAGDKISILQNDGEKVEIRFSSIAETKIIPKI